MIEVSYVPEFEKDLRKIKVNLKEDFDRFEKVLLVEFPKLLPGVVKISNLGEGILPVFKARKFRCKALQKGTRSGIRVIYTHNKYENKIVFIGIYYKGKNENHDKERILKYAIKLKD
jgi:mRNA-degrading endonuclease RelE of RelBE toxin-antitoxin system